MALGSAPSGHLLRQQAVNTIQSIRADIRGLSKDIRSSFVKSNQDLYHELADLLLSQNRLGEAEQILNLLKDEEYFEFLRRDGTSASSPSRRAVLTAEEAGWEKKDLEIRRQLVTEGTRWAELVAKQSLTPQETKELDQLERDLGSGNVAFEKFVDDLAGRIGATSAGAVQMQRVKLTRGIMEDLHDLPAGTIAIYTVVGVDKYSAIMVTPNARKAYEYPIREVDLNRKVLQFRQVVQDPGLDPRPMAKELYQILIGNMADDLHQAKAKTIMWSL